jgi:hypothetical protein
LAEKELESHLKDELLKKKYLGQKKEIVCRYNKRDVDFELAA